MQAILKVLNQQRMILSSALIVGLVLVLLMHAPVVPVVLGCFFASGLSIVRSNFRSRHVGLTKEG